ncbi:MAG: nucleoside deaminase [Sphingobacteriaceae bacterium]|nr:nucleoside deaminase [Sphingobacteriaceae bacterium]
MHERFLAKAVALSAGCLENLKGGPFGAVIVKDGEIIATGVNEVLGNNDPTAHAEVQAIRAASSKLNNFDLAGCVIYSSCEPCPMCLAAIYWARIDAIYFANSREDAAAIGFDDAFLYEEMVKSIGQRKIPTYRVDMELAKHVFYDWSNFDKKQLY